MDILRYSSVCGRGKNKVDISDILFYALSTKTRFPFVKIF